MNLNHFLQEDKEERKQEAVDNQNLSVTGDVELKNDTVESSAVMSETLRRRQLSTQSRVTSITSVNNDLELTLHRYSWQLIFIWFFSVIIISLILRRLFFLQNGAIF